MDTLLQLDPAKVLADDNTRFNLKPTRIAQLADSIMESGGVLTPVEVEVLSPAVNGHTHRLTAGFYRHAAVSKLNKEQNAGLTLPAIARSPADKLDRLRHQLAENIERESMSPMDQAVAIQKLLDAGVSRVDIRRIFARPGGRKGNVVQPASNAWVNMTLRFLELPKAIQEKIHDGRVGTAAAYELGKVPPEKRAAVLERAEADRLKQIEAEEKEEAKYLEAEAKLTDAVKEEQSAKSEVELAKAKVEEAVKLVDAKTAELKAIQKEPYLELAAEEKAKVTERLKAAEADVKGAQKALKDAQNEVAKLLGQQNKAAEKAKALRDRLDAARKAVKAAAPAGQKKATAKKAVNQEDVKKAAAKEGVKTGAVALNASEIKQAVKDVMKGAGKDFPKVAKIAAAFEQCFAGQLTPKQLIADLATITGEKK